MRRKALGFLFLVLSSIISCSLAVNPAAGIHGYAWNPRNVEDAAVWRSSSSIDWGSFSELTFETWYGILLCSFALFFLLGFFFVAFLPKD